MATEPSKVNLSDATISICPVSDLTNIAEFTCIMGEMSLSLGEREFTEDECHKGSVIGTGPLKYPEGELSFIFDSSGAAEAQKMLEEALNQVGDFANDNGIRLSIEFNNAITTKGATIEVDLIIGSGNGTFPVTGNSMYSAKYKQQGAYTITPAT
jgi:hypothetical protein